MEIVNFIVEYWQYISIALVLLFEFVLILLKGKKSIAITDGQYQLIIDWIQEAERIYGRGNGSLKLQYVIDKFRERYPYSNMEDWVIRSTVNDVLDTPTKKGGPGREKTQ